MIITNFMIEIPGPLFLLIYAILGGIMFLWAKNRMKNYYTTNFEPPKYDKLSPYDIAYLQQGKNGLSQLALYKLWKNGFLEFESEEKYIKLKKLKNNELPKNEIEQRIYKEMNNNMLFRSLNTKELEQDIRNFANQIKDKLKDNHLLPDDGDLKHNNQLFISTLLLMLVVGGYKLFEGVSRGKPVLFLVAFIIITIVVWFAALRQKADKKTPLAKQFIDNSKHQLEWMKKPTQNREMFQDDMSVYGLAFFGMAAFSRDEFSGVMDMPLELDKSLRQSQGVGTSCGGCSAGGCSSSCGGGGGCGGGCGGCGGCGG